MSMPVRNPLRRAIAGMLATTIALGPIAPAYAAPIPIADQPLQGGTIAPNVMFTFDNSFSMGYPWVANLLNTPRRNREGATTDNERPASAFPSSNSTDVGGTNLRVANDPSVYSAQVNKLYYDPAKRYEPGVNWDGTPFPPANPRWAPNDPYAKKMGSSRLIFDESVDLASTCAPHRTASGDWAALTWLSYYRDEGRNPPSSPAYYGILPGTVKPSYLPGTFNYHYPNGTYCTWAIGTHALGGYAGGIKVPNPTIVANQAFYYNYVIDPARGEYDTNGVWQGCDGTPQNMRMPQCFDRVDIIDPSKPGVTRTSYPASAARTDCTTPGSPTGCSYAEEIQNFANYWSYHRTRSVSMKTHLGRALASLPTTNGLRIGFNSVNKWVGNFNDFVTDPGPGGYRPWVDPAPWTDAQKKSVIEAFYSVLPEGNQHLRRSMMKVNDFLRGKASGATDPQQFSCQGGMNLIATDTAGWQEFDSDIEAALPRIDRPYAGYNNGNLDGFAANPFATRALGAIDVKGQHWTLADLTMFYATKDLRDASEGNCTGTNPSLDLCTDNMVPTAKDPATFNHIRTSIIGVGFEGRPYRSDYETSTNPADFFNKVKAGTDDWQHAGSLEIDYTGMPINAGWKAIVDNYWHAAVNGRGTYFNPRLPEDLTKALTGQFTDYLAGGPASAAGTVVSTPAINASTPAYSFGVKFYPSNWSGDVYRRRINPTTGLDDPTDDWNARTRLESLAGGSGWDTNRKIVTIDANSLPIPFRANKLSANQLGALDTSGPISQWTNLTSAQKSLFGNSVGNFRKAIVDFLRGDRSKERDVSAGTGVFRKREFLFGDIVGSEAVYVQAPMAPLGESTNMGYAAFKAAKATRAPMIYVAANDGMVHAIDAATGDEKWAYVPRNLFRDDAKGLAALSYAEGGTPGFAHKYYADGTPLAIDVDFSFTYDSPSATTNWRTLLVGGLNKGGNSIYALDITEASDVSTGTSESAVASAKVLWEFDGNVPGTSTAEIGYTFGKPIVAKTRAWGWVVIAASGYNNADGKGYVFVLDAKTGALHYKFETGSGSASNPSGLAKLVAYSSNFADGFVEQVYGGDLNGDVWRFDFSLDTFPTSPAGTKIAVLKAPDGTRQPVTARPRIEIDRATGRRVLFIGTGKYLDPSDADLSQSAARQLQTMYAIYDGNRLAPATWSTPLDARTLTPVSSANGVSAVQGWLEDFTAGEKIIIDPRADGGAIIYTASKPGEDQCSSGVSGRLFARLYGSAQSVLTTSSGGRAHFVNVAEGIVKNDTVRVGGEIAVRLTNARGESLIVGVAPTSEPVNRGRVSWREIVE